MSESGILADSSSLIYLAKAEGLTEAVEVLGRLRIVPAVWAEAVDAREKHEKEDARRIREASERRLLDRVSLDPEMEAQTLKIASEYRLDRGEAEVLAVSRLSELVLMDDTRAARAAKWLGRVPCSAILLPSMGVERHLFDRARALDLLDRISVVRTIRADLLAAIKAGILEKT